MIQKQFLLLAVLSIFTACKGQEKHLSITNNQSKIGKTVLNLDQEIWSIYQDKNKNYWFGSKNNGVFQYDGKNIIKYTEEDGLIDNSIREIQGDSLGNIYIGTPEGVCKYDGTTFTTLQPIVSSTNEWRSEPNDLWFNCNGNHIYRYDGKNLYELLLPEQDLKKAFGIDTKGVPFEGMNNSPYAVYGIDKDKKGNVWFGTVTAGAFRYDGKSFLWISEKELSTLPDGRVPGVRSIIEDKDGNIWLSNFISKYRITENDSVVHYEKMMGVSPSEEIFQTRIPYFISGFSDNNGDLWMVTYAGGLWKYDGSKLLNWEVDNGETEVLLISIYQDNKGMIWLGSDNAGVFIFDGDSFEKFDARKH